MPAVSNLVDRVGQDNFSNWLNYKRKMNDDAKLPISDKSWMTKIEHMSIKVVLMFECLMLNSNP